MYFAAICFILWVFGICCGSSLNCTSFDILHQKNLATLPENGFEKVSRKKGSRRQLWVVDGSNILFAETEQLSLKKQEQALALWLSEACNL
jgi:hypothetical protein